jgi:hypothetical protein
MRRMITNGLLAGAYWPKISTVQTCTATESSTRSAASLKLLLSFALLKMTVNGQVSCLPFSIFSLAHHTSDRCPTCEIPGQLSELPLPPAAAALLDGLCHHTQALSTQRTQRRHAPLTRLANSRFRVLQACMAATQANSDQEATCHPVASCRLQVLQAYVTATQADSEDQDVISQPDAFR